MSSLKHHSKKFKDFIEGTGSITSRTMGLISDLIDNNKKKPKK